jgi:N6-L-threonylcarbamoyladenine synthase
MTVLGIETSCDETSVAILRADEKSNRCDISCNLIASQIEAHQLFGGVVPEIASRKHLEVLNPLLEAARKTAEIEWRNLDLVCVTHGPGLVGALLVGVAAGKALSLSHQIPVQPVNHLEGHIASNFLAAPDLKFPMLCLVVSGGHCELVLMPAFNQFQRLGRTRDDAVGEAFDKVARALGLPLPGGPNLEKVARAGDELAFNFTVSQFEESLDFSYSGLKTAAAQAFKKKPDRVADIAASFQRAAIEQLCRNARTALQEYSAATLGVCGGVAANSTLRGALENVAREANVEFVVPDKILCTDNAAMIAAAGYFRYRDLPNSQREYSVEALDFEAHSILPLA